MAGVRTPNQNNCLITGKYTHFRGEILCGKARGAKRRGPMGGGERSDDGAGSGGLSFSFFCSQPRIAVILKDQIA